MGDQPKPTHAYMIPLDEHGQFHSDKSQAMALKIYKIPVDGIALFRKKFPGIKWGALYDFYDMTALEIFKDLNDEDTGKRKK